MFGEWYFWLSKWLATLSQPFANLYYSVDTPIYGALLLGLVASLAPCQVSTNAGALAFIMNRLEKTRSTTMDVIAFVVGKAVVYILFGLFALWLGDQLSQSFIPMFVFIRELLGPIFLLVCLLMLGWVRLPGGFGMKISQMLKEKANRMKGARGTFLLGIGFSLGWCPTMFSLFFGLLVPLMISEPGGVLLPPVFALGTILPILFIMGIFFVIGIDQMFIRKSRRIGQVVQKTAGVVFVLIGINDILAYWF
jgi:cytochrome c-type biogenesis protein